MLDPNKSSNMYPAVAAQGRVTKSLVWSVHQLYTGGLDCLQAKQYEIFSKENKTL